MRFSATVVALVALLAQAQNCDAFSALNTPLRSQSHGVSNSNIRLAVATSDVVIDSAETEAVAVEAPTIPGWKDITSMSYRQLQKNLKEQDLDPVGTTAVLKERLHVANGGDCVIDRNGKPVGDCAEDEVAQLAAKGISFTDASNNEDFDFDELVKEIMEKAEVNHWKKATRKLKKLKKNFATPEKPVPEEVYLATLKACMADRLNGARASEPARRIIEDMTETGYSVPFDMINYCILNSLGEGPDGTHDNCGGIDCALAMMAAAASFGEEDKISEETYARVATVLSNSDEIEDALAMLNTMVVEKSYTPSLGVFADIAKSTANFDPAETVKVLALAKAAGYELDTCASTDEGRTLLAAGIVGAEKIDNVALGLRLLTEASKAKGCEPDRGDILVLSSSPLAQRAASLIHKRAINKAVEASNWKLSVKLMELMLERSLRTSPKVWKNVVTCCAKNEKSRKATALLLDWVKLAEAGKMEKPAIRVFNTVVNACEICEEQELTLVVLEAMRSTQDTEGTIITFNIALKRLARQGNVAACEGIIIGMLQQQVEPTVVSYTTAIAACATEGKKDPKTAYEWMNRMRSRNITPNVITYNTALAACLDGNLESTMLGSKIAMEMLADVDKQLEEGIKDNVYTTVFPDVYTKTVARKLMKQLRNDWREGSIDMKVAKATLRKPLLQLVDFTKSERAEAANKAADELKANTVTACEDDIDTTARDETELEYAAAASSHRTAEV